jgi:hypothetical protein
VQAPARPHGSLRVTDWTVYHDECSPQGAHWPPEGRRSGVWRAGS